MKCIHIDEDAAKCVIAVSCFMTNREPEQMFYLLFTALLEISTMLNMPRDEFKKILCEAVDGARKTKGTDEECQTH